MRRSLSPPAKRRRLNDQDVNIDRDPPEASRASTSRALFGVVKITEDYELQVGDRFAASAHADIHRATMVPSGGTECQVAVKILRYHGTLGSPAAYEDSLARIDKRLRRELEIWKRLEHPHITPLLAYVESSSELVPGSGAALISPYRKNGDLLRYLANKPSANKLLLLQQVCKGLNYIHTLNPPVAHLDLKPENVLINDEEEAELCDFGLAKALEEVRTGHTTSTIGGTVIYMAPEALNGDCRTTESDIYAMGGVILHVVSGLAPWRQTRQLKVMAEVSQGRKPPREEYTISGYDSPVVEAIWVLMRRCWSFNPPDRPQSWEVLNALVDLQQPAADNPVTGGNGLEVPHRGDIAFNNLGAAQSSFIFRSNATTTQEARSPTIDEFLEPLELQPDIQPQPDILLPGPASALEFQYASFLKPDDPSGTIEDFPGTIEPQPLVQPQPATFSNGPTNTLQSQNNLPNHTDDIMASDMHHLEGFPLRPVVQQQCNVFRHEPTSTFQSRAENWDNLSATIEHCRNELDLCPPGHPSRDSSLNNLGSALRARYDRDHDPADLSAAIQYYGEALGLRPPGHPSRDISLNNLGSALRARYNRDYDPADLSAASNITEKHSTFDLSAIRFATVHSVTWHPHSSLDTT